MKRFYMGASALAWVFLFVAGALAQETRPESRPAPSGTRLSEIFGRAIMNPAGEKLGRIQDLVLDDADGRVAYAVVDFDSEQGGDKFWVIPWDLLKTPAVTDAKAQPSARTLQIDLSRDRLGNMPVFTVANWPTMDRAFGRKLYAVFGREPYWERRGTNETVRQSGDDGLTADEQKRRPTVQDPTRTRRDVPPLDRDDLRELEPFPVGMFEARNLKVVAGTVTSIIEQTGPENDFGVGVRLLVRRDDQAPRNQDLLVYVGPSDFVKKQQGFSFKQNDKVTLTGAEMDRDDRRVFVATEIAMGDRILMLRRENGLPLWRRKAVPRAE
jgi:sporulation protein YlmC with PRC-barrel domain